MSEVFVRPMEDDDDLQLRALAERSADGGRIAFRPVHRTDARQARAVRRPGAAGFVAQVGANGPVVGEAWVTPHRVAHGRGAADLAWLHGLSVDPDWRRQGVARLLTDARLAHVAALDGPVIVAAAIQAGNLASMASARRWCDRVAGSVRVTPVPPPGRTPRPMAGVEVRPVRPDDLREVAAGIRETARGLALAPLLDPDELAAWLAAEVAGDPIHEYLVAVGPSGRVLAGLGLQDEGRLQSLEIVSMPAALRLANRFLNVVPRDGHMRNGNVRLPLVRRGFEDAARHLWQEARWRWRTRTSSMVTATDPAGPLAAVLPSARWLPSTRLEVVVRDHPDLEPVEGPLAPWV